MSVPGGTILPRQGFRKKGELRWLREEVFGERKSGWTGFSNGLVSKKQFWLRPTSCWFPFSGGDGPWIVNERIAQGPAIRVVGHRFRLKRNRGEGSDHEKSG